MKRNHIIVLMLLLSIQTIAQNFTILPLPTQRLLPASSVHCLIQDAEGFLWYGTEGGLCRDNGYQIDVFRPANTDQGQEAYKVNCIAENAGGDIFFGTADGLFRVGKKDYAIHRVELDDTQHFIEALTMDSQQHLWVGTNGSVFECDEEGRCIRKFPCNLNNQPASVASIMEDSNGTIYVLQWRSGILRKNRGEKAFSSLQWTLSATPLQMMEDIQNQCYWVLTSGAGIQRMFIEGNSCLLKAQPATMGDAMRNRTLYMLRDNRHGLFWTTTHDNLYAYRLGDDGQLQEFPLTAWFPMGKKILDQMCQDKNGNIYVAGYTPHTFIISSPNGDILRQPIDAIRRQTGYPLLADRSVYDNDHFIWIWQGRQGLMLYQREDDSVESVPFSCDRTIQHCSLGGIWASFGSSIYHLWQIDGTIHQEETIKVPEEAHIRCMYEKAGEALYFATDSTLYRLTLAGLQLSTMASIPNAPHDIALGRDGTIYLALGNGGIWQVTFAGDVQRMDQSHESFLSVCTLADGSVWTSTSEGNVYHYSPANGKLSRESLLCSTNKAAVKSIRVDGLGHIWTMTDQEVCEYAPQTHAFRTFRSSDPSIDVSYFYTFELIDQSHMCVGGAGALIEIQSSAELSTQESAQVHPRLTAVLVNGEKRLVGYDAKKLSLAADEEDVTLQLTTFDHLHASSISFAWQLEGVQEEWIYLPQGTNSIILNNLPKGNHNLRVIATDRHGLWSQPVCIITIHRAAHWWETWWAYLIYIGIAIAIVYAIWRLERRIHLLRRLIRRRQEVRLNEIEFKRDDIAELQRNDEFLKRAISKVEENLSLSDYNVEALADDLCMSRITFYRRLQEQTGQTPSSFIRDIRLKKAASLLIQHPNATISDIARKVGFVTPKYFSRCFKEKFGVLPKDYRIDMESK